MGKGSKKKQDTQTTPTTNTAPASRSRVGNAAERVFRDTYPVRVSSTRVPQPQGHNCVALVNPSCLCTIEVRVGGLAVLSNLFSNKQRVVRVWISTELSQDEISVDDDLRDALGITSDGQFLGICAAPTPHQNALSLEVEIENQTPTPTSLMAVFSRLLDTTLRNQPVWDGYRIGFDAFNSRSTCTVRSVKLPEVPPQVNTSGMDISFIQSFASSLTLNSPSSASSLPSTPNSAVSFTPTGGFMFQTSGVGSMLSTPNTPAKPPSENTTISFGTPQNAPTFGFGTPSQTPTQTQTATFGSFFSPGVVASPVPSFGNSTFASQSPCFQTSPFPAPVTFGAQHVQATNNNISFTCDSPVSISPARPIAPFAVVGPNTTIELISKQPQATEQAHLHQKQAAEHITWQSIGGLGGEMQKIKETVEASLKTPEVFQKYGIKPCTGILLHGPPGTGKTLIARALASTLSLPLVCISGPEVVGRYYGETEQNIRDVFSQAKAQAPSIIFLDEVDSIAPRHDGSGMGGASTEADARVIGCLVAQLDALGSHEGADAAGRVVVIAATNRPDELDPAIRRPGRLDIEIEIGVPSATQRLDILSKLLSQTNHSLSDVDMLEIAQATHGFVGADLAQVVREASLVALQAVHSFQVDASANKFSLQRDHLNSALLRVRPSSMREIMVEVPSVKWEDIGGQGDVKQRLKEAIEWPLKHQEAFSKMGITPPKGLLLYGPPGCSKTLMAKALATESGVNFIAIKGPELFSKWVGESERAVARVFAKARAAAPCVIFFDEIDAIGGARGSGEGENGVEARVLSQLLVELDGVTPLKQVTFVAATNRPDALDPALLRPGRIDRALYVQPPNANARLEILSIHTRRMPLADDIDLNAIAQRTERYTGAELAAVCREAGLQAMGRGPDVSQVVVADFEKSLQIVGPRLSPFVDLEFQKFAREAGLQHV